MVSIDSNKPWRVTYPKFDVEEVSVSFNLVCSSKDESVIRKITFKQLEKQKTLRAKDETKSIQIPYVPANTVYEVFSSWRDIFINTEEENQPVIECSLMQQGCEQ